MIIAEDVDGEALAALIVNKMRGTLKVVAVKAPDFGERRKLVLRSVADENWTVSITASQPGSETPDLFLRL